MMFGEHKPVTYAKRMIVFHMGAPYVPVHEVSQGLALPVAAGQQDIPAKSLL